MIKNLQSIKIFRGNFPIQNIHPEFSIFCFRESVTLLENEQICWKKPAIAARKKTTLVLDLLKEVSCQSYFFSFGRSISPRWYIWVTNSNFEITMTLLLGKEACSRGVNPPPNKIKRKDIHHRCPVHPPYTHLDKDLQGYTLSANSQGGCQSKNVTPPPRPLEIQPSEAHTPW